MMIVDDMKGTMSGLRDGLFSSSSSSSYLVELGVRIRKVDNDDE